MVSKTILIADDDFAITRIISVRLELLGYSVIQSPDAAHALQTTQKLRPDLVILDVDMPGGNGMAVCEMLATDRTCADIHVIIHTSYTDSSLAKRCKQLGAHYVQKTSDSWEQIKAIVCSLVEIETDPIVPAGSESDVGSKTDEDCPSPAIETNEFQATPLPTPDLDVPKTVVSEAQSQTATTPARPRVLWIDDEPEVSRAAEIRLDRFGVEVLRAFTGHQGYQLAIDQEPDVIVTDLVLPEGEGCYIMYLLKSHPAVAKIPVIVLTGQGYPEIKRQLLNLGVATYLTKPINFGEFVRELRNYIDFADSPLPVSATEQLAKME